MLLTGHEKGWLHRQRKAPVVRPTRINAGYKQSGLIFNLTRTLTACQLSAGK